MTGYGENLDDQYHNFIAQIVALGFEYLSEGSFRTVYRRKAMVIKIPYTTDGINDNRVEAAAWRRYRGHPTSRDIRLAPCRLLPNLCLMMVAVNTNISQVSCPRWVSRVDSEQVGIYKGEVVAYDYACDIVERRKWEEQWYGSLQSEWYADTLRAERRAEREGNVG